METGCIKGKKPIVPIFHYNFVNNTAQTQVNEQYVHNGKGTAIVARSNMKFQPTYSKWNNEKVCTSLLRINIGNDHRKLIVGAIHADNGITKRKIDKTIRMLQELGQDYSYP